MLALLIDLSLGDPPILYRVIPHPVVIIGYLISWGERQLNRGTHRQRLLSGIAVTTTVVALVALAGFLCQWLTAQAPLAWLWQALIASTLLAARSLYDHVQRVAVSLGDSLTAGRSAVAHIVGRDPEQLDTSGVARAAIESAAENFADGVIAPIFWFALLGLPGLFAYKAVNTLDSMIGHRNERYEYFGKAAARLDDLVNWPPSRLSGLLFILGSCLLPTARPSRAWQTMWRDAGHHRSINAGWPESAVAGALDIRLAGPRRYPNYQVNDLWIGSGREQLTHNDIDWMLRLYRHSTAVLLILIAAVVGLYALFNY